MRVGGHGQQELVDVMQVRDQLEPERDLGGTVVVSDTRLETNVEVQLLFRGVFRPGNLLKAVWFCVDELSVLRNWLVWISGERENKRLMYFCILAQHIGICDYSNTL